MTDPQKPEACDVLCCARVTATRENVRRHLLAIAKASLSLRGEFSVIYHLTADNPATLPAGLAMYDRGPVPPDAIPTARIVVDVDDGAPDRATRLSALKNVGASVLAEDGAAARACFPPEALFTTPEQLVDKVYAALR